MKRILKELSLKSKTFSKSEIKKREINFEN